MRWIAAILLMLLPAFSLLAEEPAEHVWELNSYLHGTTAEVRYLLNGEVERFLALKADRQKKVDEQVAFIETAEKAIIAEVRATDAYRKRVEERASAETAMQAVQGSDDVQARMDASSRFNKARLAMEAMERRALHDDPILIRARADLAERQKDLKRVEPPLAKAEAWRNELLDALRDTFRLRYPLEVGDVGTLGRVTPGEITGPDSMIIVYAASEFMELVQDATQGEGIKTYSVLNHNVRMIVRGIDTSAITPGEETFIDRTFRVDEVTSDRKRGLTCTVSRTNTTDEDRLFEAVVPLRTQPEARESILSN